MRRGKLLQLHKHRTELKPIAFGYVLGLFVFLFLVTFSNNVLIFTISESAVVAYHLQYIV